jgi:pimeloyl-ACP methyl ester carboxylesterase
MRSDVGLLSTRLVKYSSYLTEQIEGAKQVVTDGGTHSVMRESPSEYNRAIEYFLSQTTRA